MRFGAEVHREEVNVVKATSKNKNTFKISCSMSAHNEKDRHEQRASCCNGENAKEYAGKVHDDPYVALISKRALNPKPLKWPPKQAIQGQVEPRESQSTGIRIHEDGPFGGFALDNLGARQLRVLGFGHHRKRHRNG